MDKIEKQKTAGKARSGHWPTIRKEFLKKHPECVVCGGKKKLEVHHIRPFHMHPELELDFSNLITLCEDKDDGLNCHLAVGHLGCFKSYNANVNKDAAVVSQRIKTRPR